MLTNPPPYRPSDFSSNKPWPRDFLYPILQTALQVKEYRFVRQTSLNWLAAYPGDLPVDLLHGQALLGEGHIRQAQRVAEKICERDPEFLEAQELLTQAQQKADVLQRSGLTGDAAAQGNILALGGQPDPIDIKSKDVVPIPKWAKTLKEARQALLAKDFTRAEANIQQALTNNPDSPLTALTHLRIMAAQTDTPRPAIQSLAQHFHQRWPECIQFILLLADSIMDGGDSDQAVALLHQATVYDVTGQVAERMWGPNHPYRDLWPRQLSAAIDNPIPARVTAALGWNLLGMPVSSQEQDTAENEAGTEIFQPIATIPNNSNQPKVPVISESDTEETENSEGELAVPESSHPHANLPETLKSVQAELEKVGERLQKPSVTRTDGRFPTYVIFTTRRGLRNKFGRAGAAMLDAAMQELAETMRNRSDWGSLVYYGDEPACTAQFGLKPSSADDPWALKLGLADLDAALGKQGAMIGALLIVGGPDIVPFHSLPNPTDDPDAEVPSDNPYATRDENYFIPEWSVGRLPGGADQNPALLLGLLQAIRAHHAATNKGQTATWWQHLWDWLVGFLKPGKKAEIASFGYSAEVWRKASLAVYQEIGSPREMITSPPVDLEQQQMANLIQGHLGYFNLHGLADTDEWYGQRDPGNGSQGPDYPVALRVQDVRNGGSSPEIIFSEACYGAHILDKNVESSLALKFLSSGSRVMVGSTVMSYGSIGTPLNAADLLGESFWKLLKDGHPAGEALRRGKINLAREMHKRQGYLDGEDQKTLISFVLFGDPLALLSDVGARNISRAKSVVRSISPPPQVKTVCDRVEAPGTSEPIPEEVMTNVKQVVAQYLPGMHGADVVMSHEHIDCNCEGHYCPTGQMGPKARPSVSAERRVVTLSKSIPVATKSHPTYARLTLNKEGKVVKLAVSR